MNSVYLLLTFLLGALVASFMLPRIILISFRKRLFDTIDNRKVHSGIVPRLGGVSFVPSMVIAIAFVAGLEAILVRTDAPLILGSPRMALLLCGVLLLYMEGVADDLIGVGYKAKFAFQILCGVGVIASGIWLNDLGGLFGIHALPAWVGMPLSVLLIVFIINAINLIDGIDGLASGLSGIALFFLGCLFSYTGDMVGAVMAFAALGPLVPFFLYNVFGRADRHRKIFMGDCGSQTIGFVLAVLAISFCQHDEARAAGMPSSPVVAFSLLMVPCLDVIRVMIGRIRRGCNPFMPDKTHIHHKFLALGMSHRTTMVTIIMISAFFGLLNLSLAAHVNINWIFLLDIILWTLLQIWLTQMIKKKQEKLAQLDLASSQVK